MTLQKDKLIGGLIVGAAGLLMQQWMVIAVGLLLVALGMEWLKL